MSQHPVNCQQGGWRDATGCSASCGGGSLTQVADIYVQSANGMCCSGDACNFNNSLFKLALCLLSIQVAPHVVPPVVLWDAISKHAMLVYFCSYVDELVFVVLHSLSCCVCECRTAPQACQDTPGWQNGHGFNCVSYAQHGWCSNRGFSGGQEWTGRSGGPGIFYLSSVI